VYQTSLLSGATYTGGGWLSWLSASSVEMLDWAQNRNLRIITGQLASTPTDALRVEAGLQSFGCLRDRAATAALERLLRLNPATHPRAAQADSGVIGRFKRGVDARSLGREAGCPWMTPTTCSHICHLGVGKEVLDCLSIP
jgi:hypothetical protein